MYTKQVTKYVGVWESYGVFMNIIRIFGAQVVVNFEDPWAWIYFWYPYIKRCAI